MTALDKGNALLANAACYDSYYDKSPWWFRFRYDTQIKRRTVLWLLRRSGCSTVGKEVLEIGFGSGAVLFSFAKSCGICGIETSSSAVNAARLRARQLGYNKTDLRLAKGDSLPFPDARFDIVVASHVLEHVVSDDELLKEFVRVLKPRGVAVILVPINERYYDPKHVRAYTPNSLVRQVSAVGLNPIVQLENELLFYAVERFYTKGYNKRWPILGPLIVATFNFPLALLPLGVCRLLDRLLSIFGLPARQVGIVFEKPGAASVCHD